MRLAPFALPLLAALAAGSLSGAAPKQTPTHRAPYAPAYEPNTVDERGIWMEADEAERHLRDSPLVIKDAVLNDHVRRVLCQTVGQDRCKSVRIYVLEVPAFNASMAANGMMVVWSGLLLRTRSEAELGAVLGHEFAHFELRHTLNGFKQRRTASDILSWAAVLGGLTGTNTSVLQWTLVGSVFKFNRTQEQEADLLGLKYLASSNYPAGAAANLWQNIMSERDATELGRKRKPRQRYGAGFFDTHPTDLNRALYLQKTALQFGTDGDPKALSHREALRSTLPSFLAAQVKLNDFGGTEYLLQELAKTEGWTGDLLYARGELYRTRGNPRDLVTAAQFYDQAIASGYDRPEVRRNLGLTLMRSGDAARARSELTAYLKLQPDASDAKAISALVAN